jgi:hypothetical protein
MLFKLTLPFLLLAIISACSIAPVSSQASIDTRACNAISYGNNNADIQSMDGLYQTCMDDKKHLRKQHNDEVKRLAFFEFFLELFWSSEMKDN